MRVDLTVLGAWTERIVAGLERRGVDVAAICRDHGLDYRALTDPDVRVPRDAVAVLWREAGRQSRDRHLGLRTGETLELAVNSVLAHLTMSSGTLLEAARRAVRFQRVVAHGDVLAVRERDDAIALVFTPLPGDVEVTRHEVEFLGVFLARFSAFVSAGDFPLRRVDFALPHPGDPAEHERVFGCPVRFAQPENALVAARAVMLRPLRHASREVVRHLEHVADSYLASVPGTSIAGRLRDAVRTRLAGGRCDVAGLAADLHLSERTLQRRLTAEGTSVRRVLDAVRHELSVAGIEAGEVPGRVASRAGFSDVRAFRRAFIRWTGHPPSAHRAASRSAR